MENREQIKRRERTFIEQIENTNKEQHMTSEEQMGNVGEGEDIYSTFFCV